MQNADGFEVAIGVAFASVIEVGSAYLNPDLKVLLCSGAGGKATSEQHVI